MEIGEKLREARVAAGQTQEKVAETIGVSRQTISNWENNRSYPDIINVLSLSDLYHVSLDTLLKEDQGMIAHLEESTNVVKSRDVYKRQGQIRGELCTPTGAALLAQFAESFGPMPIMRVQKVGIGIGTKTFEQANCVRAFWGETADESNGEKMCIRDRDMDDGYHMKSAFYDPPV